VSTSERDEKIKSGEALFWKAGWVGDYPDAESYLRLFYAPSPENTYGIDFHHSDFDQLYLKSLLTTQSSEKRRFQEACETIVFNESAIVPVYTEDFFVMINLRVRGFEMNPSGIIDFSNIYLKDVAR
jgi:peptide/nickel transport system substrate-binding protein